MGLQINPYVIARLMVEDAPLCEETKQVILGRIRARDLEWLASCSASGLSPAYPWDNLTYLNTLMQIEALFKKNAALSACDCERKAYKSFVSAEVICRITNRRLDWYLSEHPDRIDPELSSLLSSCRRYISRVLGAYEGFFPKIPDLVRFTAGASSTRKRSEALPPLKLSKRMVCTPGAQPFVDAITRYFGYGRQKARLTTQNRVEFVPKNWKTHRTIACEPDGNLPLQLAFDTYAKGRLRRKAGIDLSDQGKNQRMAKEGSLSGKYATVDLSMASDTLAYNTVVALFPFEWFTFLDKIRCPQGVYKSGETTQVFDYAKFSSMGNGTTFAVETLVFSAACYAVGSEDFSVYGDDIIIETELYPKLQRLLQFLGFKVNQDKTHVAGSFRESCGANWYRGIDITPFYLRDDPRNKAGKSHVVNGLVQQAVPNGAVWKWCADYCKRENLQLIPYTSVSTEGVFIDIQSAYDSGLFRVPQRRTSASKDKNIVLKTPRRKTWITECKLYRPKQDEPVEIQDTRALFLWHLQARNGQTYRPAVTWDGNEIAKCQTPELPESRPELWVQTKGGRWVFAATNTETTRYAHPTHSYKCRWVSWYPPAEVAPVHIRMWAEFLKGR